MGKASQIKQNSTALVSLRPIWKWVLMGLMTGLLLIALINLVRTFFALHHPVDKKKPTLFSIASQLDRDWYQNEAKRFKDLPKSSLINLPAPKQDDSPLDEKASAPNMIPPSLEEERKAMAASISSNQIVAENNQAQALAKEANNGEENHAGSGSNENPNETIQEKSVQADSPAIEKNAAPYVLQAGTIIPGILMTGINSSLPGQVMAMVRTSVYDSIHGQYLLIPQGSKLIGNYESKLCFGQKRLFLIWQRIILPSGDSIRLGGMPGSDLEGYAGLKDKVDNHYGALLRSAFLMSLLSLGEERQAVNPHLNPLTVGELFSQSASQQLSEAGSKFLSKTADIDPTLTIRPGYLFNITVTKDLVFDTPYWAKP